jgi:hypothetical protein
VFEPRGKKKEKGKREKKKKKKPFGGWSVG